jgi:potassium/hydrogen antiporter
LEIAIVLMSVGGLVFLAHLFSTLFEKTRVPDVLPLVFLGLFLGPVFGVVRPEDFGKVGAVFATVTLVIMLFEGGLDLSFTALGASLFRGTYLTIINFVVTTLIVAAVATPAFGLTLIEGVMLGTILGGTSSAVIMPMVGRLPLSERTRGMLVLESTFSDVLCIVCTLALLAAAQTPEVMLGREAGKILSSFLLASIVGVAAALFWSAILRKVHELENSAFTTPAFVFIVYGIAELMGWSGAIAALAFGVFLGNIKDIRIPLMKSLSFFRPVQLSQLERSFFAEIVFLLKTFFFVYIGVSIRLNDWIFGAAAFILTLLIFLMRVPVVRLSLDRSTRRMDAMLSSVLTPKGLAAAVLASLPGQAQLPSGGVIQDIVYGVILFSIVFTAALSFLIEHGVLAKPYAGFFHTYPEEEPAPPEMKGEGALPSGPLKSPPDDDALPAETDAATSRSRGAAPSSPGKRI